MGLPVAQLCSRQRRISAANENPPPSSHSAVRVRRVSMRWSDEGRSSDLEDRRGGSPGGFGLPPIGIGGAILLLLLSLVFHPNFFSLLSRGSFPTRPSPQTPGQHATPEAA